MCDPALVNSVIVISNFRERMNLNRNIVLVHNDERYKASRVSEVLYSSYQNKGPCNHLKHCFKSNKTYKHIVKVEGDIYFVIVEYGGCRSVDPYVKMMSFSSEHDLKFHLINCDRMEISNSTLRKLWPDYNFSEEELSTDSY